MAIVAYECTSLTGGASGSLDYIDGSVINNGDIAFVKSNGKHYYYRANTSGTGTEDSPIIICPDANPGSIDWELGASNQMITITKTQADDPFTVTAAYLQAGVTIANTGASGALDLQLPAGVANYSLSCYIDSEQYLKCTADGTETFRYGANASAAGGYIRSNTIGTFWKIEWLGGEWVITALTNDLKYDE